MPSEVDSVQVAGNYVLGHSKKGYFLIDMKTQKISLLCRKAHDKALERHGEADVSPHLLSAT